jgi:hypothetical protein
MVQTKLTLCAERENEGHTLCRNPSFGLATKARGCKEARESKGSPGAKANALEGCGPRGGSPGVITYFRESKEVRGTVRE